MSHVLIVDDEPAICWSLREFLQDQGHSVQTASSVKAAKSLLSTFSPDLILLDVRMPGEDGLSAMPDFQHRLHGVPIIVMTAFGDLTTAVRAVQQGAFEYLTKPFDLSEMGLQVERALRPKPAVENAERRAEFSLPLLVGGSPAMQKLFKQIAMVADTEAPVLITGETGTGKELVAQAIHRHSRRAKRPFVPVCLAALSPSVIESELFGHVRGSFTGATEDRPGLFELAAGGTILLDELGETPLPVQVKLLRVLETRQFNRVGSGATLTADVRIVAATNRNLTELIRKGQFREDLLHRLCLFPIVAPPLRERRDDILTLARHFLRELSGDKEVAWTKDFEAALLSRTWPGNVRELRNAVAHAAIAARGRPLEGIDLPRETPIPRTATSAEGFEALPALIARWVNSQSPREGLEAPLAGDLYRQFQELVEPALFHAVLQETGDNRTAAAKWLGLDRATLRTKLRSLPVSDQESLNQETPGRDRS